MAAPVNRCSFPQHAIQKLLRACVRGFARDRMRDTTNQRPNNRMPHLFGMPPTSGFLRDR